METELRRLKPSNVVFIGLLSLVLASASVSGANRCDHIGRHVARRLGSLPFI